MSEVSIHSGLSMPLLSRLKLFLYQRALQKYRTTNIGKLPVNHFSAIKSVGILFDAAEANNRDIVMEYAENLRKTGIKVDLLGYFNTKVGDIKFEFNFIDVKNLSFASIPQGAHVEKFIDNPYDVLINLDTAMHRPLNYLAAASKALFKIGPAQGDHNHYDLMIAMPDKDLRKYLQEIRTTFNKIQG